MSEESIWQFCLDVLEQELPEQQFNTWIKPLQFIEEKRRIMLLSPNRFIDDWVRSNFFKKIKMLAKSRKKTIVVSLQVGNLEEVKRQLEEKKLSKLKVNVPQITNNTPPPAVPKGAFNFNETLDKKLTFDNFVEGKCNILARDASLQVVNNIGGSYNPFLIYGDSSTGKTHLMHAIGNKILKNNPEARILYLTSERFVQEMISAFQDKSIDKFKKYYRSANLLLIDDIQFFAGKPRSQEEFFHTFNTLLEEQQQIVMTCDRYPKEINGIEERLLSRFSWGLDVAVKVPDLDTRVMILMTKAKEVNMDLSQEVALFIAKLITTSIRDLEGALRKVIAHSRFTKTDISVDFVKTVLQDLVTLQGRSVSIVNIQKIVADYYNIKLSELLSKKRQRAISRPRQMAMFLAKELTNESLPIIGKEFSGRDHTTVLHACKKIEELKITNDQILEDYKYLKKVLVSGRLRA